MKRGFALALLLAAAVLYRVPYLLNPAALNSDGAVVGLQARHLLRGEWSWFLWGTNYQSSFDSAMHALAFAVFGSSARVMGCGTLAVALLMIALAFLTLRRHLGEAAALICCAPLVFAPNAWNHFMLMGFRQWALTAFVAAAFLLDGAAVSRWPRACALAGGALIFLMLYLDVFMLQVVPALVLLALFCALQGRAAVTAAGAAAGAVLLLLVRHGLPGETPTQLQLARLAPNLSLLETCASWIAGGQAMAGTPLHAWEAPLAVRLVQVAGALFLAAAIAFGGLSFLRRSPRIPEGARQLGLFGFVAVAGSLGGFLFSSMPVDLASARYLAPGAVAIPFALAPAAAWLGARRFALAFTPSLIALLVSGWLGYGEFVRGPLPVQTPRGLAADERALRDQLLALGIHAAAADYWLAYRLSFLWAEDPVVANVEGWERMPAYRQALEREPRIAYLFHPSVPQTPPERYEERLRRSRMQYEKRVIAGFTVLLFDNPRAHR